MFLLKKLVFKFMELGLGLRTCFSLETRNPIFINFKLSPAEADAVQKRLPPGFQLCKLKFFDDDTAPAFWVSYNLYELKYPKKELAAIRKVRCEINTFVEDAAGRKGVFVFCGSPYVSKEETPSVMGRVCDFAERLVIGIYGCGGLIGLAYMLGEDRLTVDFEEGENRVSVEHSLPPQTPGRRLSDDYWMFNDISFFNEGRTHDFVNVNSAFYLARFQEVYGGHLEKAEIRSPFFQRRPDKVYFHRGDVAYLVNSLNRGRP